MSSHSQAGCHGRVTVLRSQRREDRQDGDHDRGAPPHETAVKRGLVARNAAELVECVPGGADNSNRGAWQTADAASFLGSVRKDRLYAALLLSMLGLLGGEVLGLRWSDIDLDTGTLTVRETASRLPARSTSEPRRRERLAGYCRCRRSWSTRCATCTAGLPLIPLHGAQHCAASLLADLGYPVAIVAAWLGQSQISVPTDYQHADSLRAAGKALGQALAG